MDLEKEVVSRAKKERGKFVLGNMPTISGYSGFQGSKEIVRIYERGICIEGAFALNVKGYIPFDSVLTTLQNENSIVIETSNSFSQTVMLTFDSLKEAVKYYIKMREVMGSPISREEQIQLQADVKQERNDKAEEKQLAYEKYLEEEKRNKPESRKEKIARLQSEDKVYCPKCLSTQISAQKKGFSVGQAITFGMLAGMAGSNKVEITCLSCGNKFKPGQK